MKGLALLLLLWLLPYGILQGSLQRRCKNNREPFSKHFTYFFLWGGSAALLGVLPEQYFYRLQDLLFSLIWPENWGEWQALGRTLWLAFCATALFEETLKFILIRQFLRQHEPSGLTPFIGLGVALGFATAENFLYLLKFGSMAYLRLPTSTLLHLCLGALVARNYALKKLQPLLLAILWHGSYNAALLLGNWWAAVAILLALLLLSVWPLHAQVTH